MERAVALDAHQTRTAADVAHGSGLADEADHDSSTSDADVPCSSLSSHTTSTSSTTTTTTILTPESTTTTTTVAPPSSHLLDLEARNHDVMASLSKRDGRSPGRRMDEEAIAGTAVGVILAFALLVCCIYPVVVHYIKKHRRAKRLSFDECEYGFRGPPVLQRRLSSSDDLKNPEPSKERGFSGQDPYAAYAQGQPNRQPSAGAPNPNHDGSVPDTIEPVMAQNHDFYSNFPFYYQDVIPASAGPQQIVLKGTSEDYYSPHIPSEAFGMYPMPESENVPAQPGRSMSKGTSLRYNVRSLLRRRGMGDHAITLPVPYSDQPAPNLSQSQNQQQQQSQAHPQDPSQVQQFFYAHETAQAPTEFAPMSMDYYHPAGHHPGMDAMAGIPHGIPSQINGGPSDPSSSFSVGFPNPSTVNPMDIMPASTESEMWHRTDFQLFSSVYDESPDGAMSPSEMAAMAAGGSVMAHPHPHHGLELNAVSSQPYQPLTPVPSSIMPHSQMIKIDEGVYKEEVKREIKPSVDQSSTATMNAPPRPPVPTLPPPAVPVLSSTNPSTSSAPSSHDSPSPESLNSSDYGHSASPHDAAGVPSPRGGVYSCEEPGCNQVFDQPHKLKHHQRYHSKDHKCPYASCGKGFGTKTHLQRHINDRHEKKKKFHCSMQGCDYSRSGGKAFPRKDNWKRHMTKIHGLDHRTLPEPVEVDSDMAGT